MQTGAALHPETRFAVRSVAVRRRRKNSLGKLDALHVPEKEIATDQGLVQFREKKQLKITDLSLIPEEYWHINENEILADLKKDIAVPGAELETIQVPVNYR